MQLLLYNSDYKLNTLKKIEYGLNSNVKDGYWMQCSIGLTHSVAHLITQLGHFIKLAL